MRVRFRDQLRGRSVIDSAGNVIGEVDDVVIDSDSWQVSALRIRLKRETASAMGVRSGAFRSALFDVTSEAVKGVAETVVLNRSLRELLPTGAAQPPEAPPTH